MKFYGINALGELKIERVSTLPSYSAEHEGRIVLNQSDDLIYYATDEEWKSVSNTVTSSTSPGSSDTGYTNGTLWIDLTSDDFYVCVDNGSVTGTAIWVGSADYLKIINNLSDLESISDARNNLGLGTGALLDIGLGTSDHALPKYSTQGNRDLESSDVTISDDDILDASGFTEEGSNTLSNDINGDSDTVDGFHAADLISEIDSSYWKFYIDGSEKKQVRVNDSDKVGIDGGDAINLSWDGTRDVTINHVDTSVQSDVNTSGKNIIDSVELDTYGHITNINTRTLENEFVDADWEIKTSNFTASSNKNYIIDGGLSDVKLPVSPSSGDMIKFAPGENWASSNTTLKRNGRNILGTAEDLILDVQIGVSLVYKDNTWGWSVLNV